MIEFEKATYSRLALEEGLNKLKKIHLTVKRKNSHYALYPEIRNVKEWLEDNAGNPAAFYFPYHLSRYEKHLYNYYSSTTKAELDKLARLAKKELSEIIYSIFQGYENGDLNIQ